MIRNLVILLCLLVLYGCPKSGSHSVPASPTTVQPVQVYVAWDAHPDTTVQGYRVYFAGTLDPADGMAFVADTTGTSTTFDWLRDLGKVSVACFRLRAYNLDGLGPYTEGVCANVVDQDVKVTLYFDCGDGLAAADLTGRCRTRPQATMGALEAES